MRKPLNFLVSLMLVCSVLPVHAACREVENQSTTQALLSALSDNLQSAVTECAAQLLSTRMAAAGARPDSWEERYEIREALLKLLPTLSLSDTQHFNLLKATTLPNEVSTPDARELAADIALLRRAKNDWSSDRRGADYPTRV